MTQMNADAVAALDILNKKYSSKKAASQFLIVLIISLLLFSFFLLCLSDLIKVIKYMRPLIAKYICKGSISSEQQVVDILEEDLEPQTPNGINSLIRIIPNFVPKKGSKIDVINNVVIRNNKKVVINDINSKDNKIISENTPPKLEPRENIAQKLRQKKIITDSARNENVTPPPKYVEKVSVPPQIPTPPPPPPIERSILNAPKSVDNNSEKNIYKMKKIMIKHGKKIQLEDSIIN
jgi:hypothetical protein